MARTKKIGDLQINEDMEFQRRSWIVQRVGWLVFALVILLAALGLFGDGILSDAKAGQEEGALWLEYPRFERFEDEFQMRVHANEGAVADSEIRIHLDQNYLNGVEVKSVSPEPDSELLDANGITYVFKINGSSPFTAHFYVIPRKAGPLSGIFRLQNGDSVDFSQFIYP